MRGRSRSGAVSGRVGGFPSVPSSFRFGPVPQGRSFVASLRDRLRRPLTDRPEPESRKTAGKPPKKRHGPTLEERVRQRSDEGPGAGPPGIRALSSLIPRQGLDYLHGRLIRAP
ncbi:predicted protein [Streptomyces sp. C]|nr:predicted protein [Streptomyces sp. C]